MIELTRFRSELPCPKVVLESGEEIQFVDHEAEVSGKVVDELREAAVSDPAIGELGITELGSTPAARATARDGEVDTGTPPSLTTAGGTEPPGPEHDAYTEMGFAELDAEASKRGLHVAGTGDGGAVTEDDLRAALRDDDAGRGPSDPPEADPYAGMNRGQLLAELKKRRVPAPEKGSGKGGAVKNDDLRDALRAADGRR